jgi:hypothetical protein
VISGEEITMSAFTNKVAAQCRTELARFKNGQGRETNDPYAGYVGEYWLVGVKVKNRDGRTTFHDRDGNPFRPAWSAAFISFIMRKSGAGTQFYYHEGHIHYVVKALRDAKDPASSAKFLGRDPRTYVPKVGDLISAGRAASRNVTYSDVLRKYGTKPVDGGNFLPSHSDIVIEVNPDKRELITVGGNVETDTVGHKTWKLKADGTLQKGASLICVIECLL